MEGQSDFSAEVQKEVFYWKSQVLDLQRKNEILIEKCKNLEIELKIEKQRAKVDAMNIKLLQESLKKQSKTGLNKRNSTIYLTSSSNESISSSWKSNDQSEKTRLIEGFFIASCEPNDFSLLYSYSPNEVFSGINKEILAYFVAPSFLGTEKAELNSIDSLLSILYPKLYRDKNSFVFTLKGSGGNVDIKNFPNQSKEFLYCCCVRTQDITIQNKNPVPFNICYCTLTYIPLFDLHFEFLYKLIEQSRSTRVSTIMKPEYIFHELESLSEILSFKCQSQYILTPLEEYASYYIQPKLSINIRISSSSHIEYEVPSDVSLIDTIWPCCLVFSLLTFRELVICLAALIHKHSVIFKSANLAYLSACVLAMQALARPFVKDYIVCPVLPEQIKEILLSELSLLVGVSYELDLGKENVVLADLDNEFFVGFEVDLEGFGGVYEKCRGDYENLQKRSCYSYSMDKELACFRVIKVIRAFFEEYGERIRGNN